MCMMWLNWYNAHAPSHYHMHQSADYILFLSEKLTQSGMILKKNTEKEIKNENILCLYFITVWSQICKLCIYIFI